MGETGALPFGALCPFAQEMGRSRRNGFAETGEIEEGEIVMERRI
jgi:hypothetical protein